MRLSSATLLLPAALLLLSPCRAQTTTQSSAPAAPTQAAAATAQADETAALRLDLQGLAEEAKEIAKPLARAAAQVEVADALWALDEERAKALLREAFELTLPDPVDRPNTRRHEIASPLRAPTPESEARAGLRRRLFAVAARDPVFRRELIDASARELGREEEVAQLTHAAIEAARGGRLDEADEHLRRAIEAEPTLINISEAINAVAARDRAAADRLIVAYVERLRRLPTALFSSQHHATLRLTFAFSWLMAPRAVTGPGAAAPPPSPPSRETARAYVSFVADTLNRIQLERPGSSDGRALLAVAWPLMAAHAPEMAGQFAQLEKMGRGDTGKPFEPVTFEKMRESGEKTYEERLKLARRTKDQEVVEVAVNSARARGDFAEARKLLDLLPEGEMKSTLAEVLNADETIRLTERGDTVAAERVARQLNAPNSILRAYPPLIKRLIKDKDTSSAALLTGEAVRLLKRAEETKAEGGYYLPSALAGLVRPPKGSRLPQAISELAATIAPANDSLAFELAEELVRAANKFDAFTENGNPGFNAELFKALAERDQSRARQSAEGFNDRLQRITALARIHRLRAERLTQQQRPATLP
jgi:hypothetical protein